MIYPESFLDYCISFKYKFTSLRKSVLYILWSIEKPLKAYEILDNLLKLNNHAQAPAVYRVLDYFIRCGIVHKIESIQSFTLCKAPTKNSFSEILMVCNNCHNVEEVHDDSISNYFNSLSCMKSFSLSQSIIELKGVCQKCKLRDSLNLVV